MNVRVQYGIAGDSASAIAASVEAAMRAGRLPAGARMPTVRALADALGVSPTTVAAAYRTLRQRGLLAAHGRRGTRTVERPPLPVPAQPAPPPHLHDLANGNPDPALLPPLRPVLDRLSTTPRLYGQPANLPALVHLATRQLEADGIAAPALAVVGGAMDGLERVLQAWLRPGDRIAIEDPAYVGVIDLVRSLGLEIEPVAVDDAGLLPADLARALRTGVQALIVTPRAQNPTGAALDAPRARALAAVVARRPEVLVVEDDHAGKVAGTPAFSIARRQERWAVVRSVSKSLAPDLRVAIAAGDAVTIARVEGRQHVGAGWVSHILQEAVAHFWSDRGLDARLRAAAQAYAERREAVIAALAARGVAAHGRSGLNVWVPVPEEAVAVAALAAAGLAVRAGERYRFKTGPAVRISIGALRPGDPARIADALGGPALAGRRTATT